MNISYLVTVHNETKSLANLLERLVRHCQGGDQVVILDDFSDNETTQQILSKYSRMDSVYLYQHALDKNYGGHKNYGVAECCKGDWIFQIDADELPSDTLLLNLKDIIAENPEIDMYCVPRVNCFVGLKPEHAQQWGWQLTPSPMYGNRPRVNWPDYQGRIFKRDGKIKWDRRLHEKLEGYSKFAAIPAEEDLALYHDKTIETQIATNKRYNEWFSEDENRGHGGYENK
jgi:glycosyltransferase involved in cell wall biosynthesis